MKCGTSALHTYLGRHREMFMSEPKELNFFVSAEDLPGDAPSHLARQMTWSKGLRWYEAQFPPGYKIRGETSPNYTSPAYPLVAARIRREIPDVRLIYIVRDPYQRAVSEYRHRVAEGVERRSPRDAILDPTSGYVRRSRYLECLNPFREAFPAESLLVLTQEDLNAQRRATLRRAFLFLDVDPGFWCEGFESNVFESEGKGRLYQAASTLRRSRLGSRAVASVPAPAVAWLSERARQSKDAPPSIPDLRSEYMPLVDGDWTEFRTTYLPAGRTAANG
jgi:hypothetical protein